MHIFMQDNTNRMAEWTSQLDAGYVVDVGCRGMVAGAPPGNTHGMHGLGGSASREGTCLAGGCRGGSRTPEWQTRLAHHDVGARVMGGMELDPQAPRRSD